LQRATLADPHREYLQNVHDAGSQLLDLINDVLDVARVESGKMDLRPERIALATLLGPVLATARLAAERDGLAFVVDVPAEAAVFVDPGRMRQILNNLLSNAVKFNQPGGRVRLSAAVTTERFSIEVSDTGIGIPEESRARVFGAFERLHEAHSAVSGTGLGLALTKQLVELHGGAIAFESAVGVGTTFRVQIPLPTHQTVTGDRVLVVEDEPRDAELVIALAAAVGLRTEVVTTLADALRALRHHRPLGIVLDLRLPDGRGEAVLAALQDYGSSIPTMVVTGEDAELSNLGADDYLTKPVDSERLGRWLAGLDGTKERSDADPHR